jgi:hypothetical protein
MPMVAENAGGNWKNIKGSWLVARQENIKGSRENVDLSKFFLRPLRQLYKIFLRPLEKCSGQLEKH